jgi:hypothetical protein
MRLIRLMRLMRLKKEKIMSRKNCVMICALLAMVFGLGSVGFAEEGTFNATVTGQDNTVFGEIKGINIASEKTVLTKDAVIVVGMYTSDGKEQIQNNSPKTYPMGVLTIAIQNWNEEYDIAVKSKTGELRVPIPEGYEVGDAFQGLYVNAVNEYVASFAPMKYSIEGNVVVIDPPETLEKEGQNVIAIPVTKPSETINSKIMSKVKRDAARFIVASSDYKAYKPIGKKR